MFFDRTGPKELRAEFVAVPYARSCAPELSGFLGVIYALKSLGMRAYAKCWLNKRRLFIAHRIAIDKCHDCYVPFVFLCGFWKASESFAYEKHASYSIAVVATSVECAHIFCGASLLTVTTAVGIGVGGVH